MIMTIQITLQLGLDTSTTGNASQVAELIGASEWHILGDYLVVENPLLSYRVTDNKSYSDKLERIPNGADVILIHSESKSAELPEFKVSDNLPVKQPCCCSIENGRDERLNNRENVYLLTQVIGTANISKELRTKADTKLSELVDRII